MSMILSSGSYTDFITNNDISKSKFLMFIGHPTNYTVYGSLFETDKGLVFQQSKHIEINKSLKSPKIASKEEFTHKFVDETIFKSFKKIDYNEYCDRWGTSFNNLKTTLNEN